METEILVLKYWAYAKHTFAEAIDRYILNVSSKKKCPAKEVFRLNALKRDFPHLASKQIADVLAAD